MGCGLRTDELTQLAAERVRLFASHAVAQHLWSSESRHTTPRAVWGPNTVRVCGALNVYFLK